MPKFVVPVCIELNGSLTVEADDAESAGQAARKEYYRRLDEHLQKGGMGLAGTACKFIDSVDIEFETADPEDIEVDEEAPDSDD